MASLAYHSAIKLQPTTPSLLKNPTQFLHTQPTSIFNTSPSSSSSTHKTPFRIYSDASPKARFVARRKETVQVNQLQRPLLEYMSLPASQYSVLDAERIERVDENTFRCYVYRFKFFAFEVCPVLVVRVEEQPNGCCIKMLSCKLEGSPLVVAQNDKFDGKEFWLTLDYKPFYARGSLPTTFCCYFRFRHLLPVSGVLLSEVDGGIFIAPCLPYATVVVSWYDNIRTNLKFGW